MKGIFHDALKSLLAAQWLLRSRALLAAQAMRGRASLQRCRRSGQPLKQHIQSERERERERERGRERVVPTPDASAKFWKLRGL